MSVVTRFAPSPTGFLHIGGARTALFNWLFAHHHGGRFLLRIEDTDLARSTEEAVDAIINGLKWLDITWDGDAVSQRSRMERHAQAARRLIDEGNAYHCYASPEELAEMREAARREGRSPVYDGRWRDRSPSEAPAGVRPVVRLKAPREGDTRIDDLVQGEVTVANRQLDDMVLLRADGTPTYMLAVVVDDHDMGVTHVIRGDDHLNNAARQTQVYNAMGWTVPVWAHIPLIHGPDGKKLSKRHGAVGLEEYQAMGYPAAGMRNYLARLGWAHGDAEYFTDDQARAWFDLEGIGRAPARLDFKKLENLCGQHIAATPDERLLPEIEAFLEAAGKPPLSQAQKDGLSRGLYCLRERSKTFPELVEKAHFVLTSRPIVRDEKAEAALDSVSLGILHELTPQLQNASWSRDELEAAVAAVAGAHGLGLGKIAGPLRAALAGRAVTPSVFDMMLVIGREETIARLKDVAG